MIAYATLHLCLALASTSVPAAPRVPRLVVVPLGPVDAALVREVATALEERLALSIEVHAQAPLPAQAFYERRKRYRAEVLLEHLSDGDFGEAELIAAITEAPLSTTKGDIYDWGIAGLGNLGGKSSVSTSFLFRRLKKLDPNRYRRAIENLALHEVGHTLGLSHCDDPHCIMADARGNAVRAAALSHNEFCSRCSRALGAMLKPRTTER